MPNATSRKRIVSIKYVAFLLLLAIAECIVLWRNDIHHHGSPTTTQDNTPTSNSCNVTSIHRSPAALATGDVVLPESNVYLQPASCTWHLNATFAPSSKHFCLPWSIISDDWWTHHPGWKASTTELHQNDTHYCFHVYNPKRAKFLRRLHDIQHTSSNCDQVFTKTMWQSGWGADFAHVLDGLMYANENKVPFQVYNSRPWHYAATKRRDAPPVCPTGDLDCYFLPLSACPPNPHNVFSERDFWHTRNNHSRQPNLATPASHRWMMDYASRPQTWLRKAVYDFGKTIPLTSPCTILHVRRSDVVLHGVQSRRYHDIREYMNLTDPDIWTVLLLTDDDNAVQEALREYPNHQWVYIPRPRFHGAEGGWENQLPSSNPQFEVVVLLTIFQKVQHCQTLVYTQSNLAEYLVGIMLEEAQKRKQPPIFLNLDRGKKGTDVYSANHSIGYIVPDARTQQFSMF
jgi:hypothetical protein